MAQGYNLSQNISQKQRQRQIQKMSQKQIQAMRFLTLQNADLRQEIYKMVEENPALEIVADESGFDDFAQPRSSISSDEFQKALENTADETETLQDHLINQLNLMKISHAQKRVCTALVNSLDRNGCLPALVNPESFLDRSNPAENRDFLENCIKIVQELDPIGTCCKSLEESLFIQAQILKPDDKLSLFILDGHLEFLNPPQADRILKKIKSFQKEWHSKAFAGELLIDDLKINEDTVLSALNFILSLNPHPAAEFSYNSSASKNTFADVALIVERKEGRVLESDFSHGIVKGDENSYFQVKYPSGSLPELRIAPEFAKKSTNPEIKAYREKYLLQANDFLGNLAYRKSTIVLQGCHIVQNQIEFFLRGPGNIKPLTRRKLAQDLHIHESTVSRVSSKHNARFIQTEWGLFPISYFFSSGVKSSSDENGEEKISAEKIKTIMREILTSNGKLKISDPKLCQMLNERGIKIARRTVSKYRQQLNIPAVFDR